MQPARVAALLAYGSYYTHSEPTRDVITRRVANILNPTKLISWWYYYPQEIGVKLTTVVGVQGRDFCILAADSQITEDNLRTISLKTPKIIEKGQYLLAITGDTRPGDILTYNWNPPTYKVSYDPVQFMGKRIIPSIIKTFTDNGYAWNDNEKDKDAGFDYLIAFNGVIFHIASDMSFIQSEANYYGIGSGGQFALGYMYHKQSDKFLVRDEAAELAQKAVEVASLLDINTCPPIQIAVQKRKVK